MDSTKVNKAELTVREPAMVKARRRLDSGLEWAKNPTDKTIHQGLRYILVGGVAYLVDISALFSLTEWVGIYYLGSAAIAFVMGLVTNYALSTVWVFSHRRVDNKFIEFSVFSLIGIGGLSLNELLIWIFADVALIHYMQAKVISTVFVLLWNFGARKYLLFR